MRPPLIRCRVRSPAARLRQLGPGLITGAADDDPSGIATYSQAGAQFGYSILWSVVFTLPLMVAIQIISARIGYVTGQGLAANIKQAFPRPVLLTAVGLLLAAQTSAQAAEALRPLAGEYASLLFSLGIIGTGMLAVPVLAGSAAYAVAEAAGWQGSLSLRLEQGEGVGFYGVMAAATLGGVGLCFTPMDPVRELLWSAVINGVMAVPIMAVMMLLASRPSVMGAYVIGRRLRSMGWAATAVMALTVLALFWSMCG